MMPIYSYWSDSSPTDEELLWAMEKVRYDCVVKINWRFYGYPYSVEIRPGMKLEDCKAQIPTVYGV